MVAFGGRRAWRWAAAPGQESPDRPTAKQDTEGTSLAKVLIVSVLFLRFFAKLTAVQCQTPQRFRQKNALDQR
jgi:hypothetical protein